MVLGCLTPFLDVSATLIVLHHRVRLWAVSRAEVCLLPLKEKRGTEGKCIVAATVCCYIMSCNCIGTIVFNASSHMAVDIKHIVCDQVFIYFDNQFFR